jgi:hypothetical protein
LYSGSNHPGCRPASERPAAGHGAEPELSASHGERHVGRARVSAPAGKVSNRKK